MQRSSVSPRSPTGATVSNKRTYLSKCVFDDDRHMVQCECHDNAWVNHCAGCNELLDCDIVGNPGPYRCHECRVKLERDEAVARLSALDAAGQEMAEALERAKRSMRGCRIVGTEGNYRDCVDWALSVPDWPQCAGCAEIATVNAALSKWRARKP